MNMWQIAIITGILANIAVGIYLIQNELSKLCKLMERDTDA